MTAYLLRRAIPFTAPHEPLRVLVPVIYLECEAGNIAMAASAIS